MGQSQNKETIVYEETIIYRLNQLPSVAEDKFVLAYYRKYSADYERYLLAVKALPPIEKLALKFALAVYINQSKTLSCLCIKWLRKVRKVLLKMIEEEEIEAESQQTRNTTVDNKYFRYVQIEKPEPVYFAESYYLIQITVKEEKSVEKNEQKQPLLNP